MSNQSQNTCYIFHDLTKGRVYLWGRGILLCDHGTRFDSGWNWKNLPIPRHNMWSRQPFLSGWEGRCFPVFLPHSLFTFDTKLVGSYQEVGLCQHLKPWPCVSCGVTHQMCLVLWTWRKLADELMQRTHPRSVERLFQLEGYRQPSLSISCKVKTILMQRMNTSSL